MTSPLKAVGLTILAAAGLVVAFLVQLLLLLIGCIPLGIFILGLWSGRWRTRV